MSDSILYLGDTALNDAAAYLAGVLSHAGFSFDYIPSTRPAIAELFDEPRALYVFSDYPAVQLSGELQRRVVEHVESGSGLLMCGGWESFHGLGGDWDGTPIGEILPVEISENDDRVNCDHPVLVRRVEKQHWLDALPWDERPPVIGGFNRVRAKPEGRVLLEAVHFSARCRRNEFAFTETGRDPLLIVGTHGNGRTAAFATDVAPHWVGPLVDWGDGRVVAQAVGANEVEVGDLYARFLRELVSWTSGGSKAG